jgi:hypothetical protein
MNLKKVYSIGLMSGTSLDGVDIVSEVFPMIEKYNLEIENVLRTFIEHIVIQISNKINSPWKIIDYRRRNI